MTTTQLVRSTPSASALAGRALAAWRESVAEQDARIASQKAIELKRQIDVALFYLRDKIGIDSGTALVEIEEHATDAPRGFVVTVDGIRFTLKDLPYKDRFDRERLHVAVECSRHCGKPLWINVESLEQLGGLLQPDATNTHDFSCLQQFDENGDPTTDIWGNPFRPREPEPLKETTEDRQRSAIDRLEQAANEYAAELSHVAFLEDRRPFVKQVAIQRIMQQTNPLSGKQHSASSAEAIVESDNEYLAYRDSQRKAETERWRCLAAWEAAKLNARIAAELFIAEECNR